MSAGNFDSAAQPPRIVFDANGFSWSYQLAAGQTAQAMDVTYGLF